MKKLQLLIIILISAMTASAQTELSDSLLLQFENQADTLASVTKAKSVSVTRSGNKLEVTIIGSEENPEYYYSHTSESSDNNDLGSQWGLSLPFLKEPVRRKIEMVSNQLYLGISVPVSAPSGLNQSVECGWGKMLGVRISPWKSGPNFAIGAGIHFEQYTLHGGQVFDRCRKQLVMNAAPDNARDIHNRLINVGFTIPLTITQKIKNDFSIAVGAELRFNTYAKASTRYSVDNVEYSQSFKQLQQRQLTPTLYGAIGWLDDIGLYVRYTPSHLFDKRWGPEFQTVSFGVTIGL
ncbi:MAG: hypothetical protein K2N91_06605 [Muribaculaceae bacterium]|nr:hypothetical protein [Muribaculaceae bacterium]